MGAQGSHALACTAARHTPHPDQQSASSDPVRRIVFCDVDGVLNTRETRARPSAVDTQFGHPMFHPSHLPTADMLQRLSFILHATDAALVLSSTWRLHCEHRRNLSALMCEHGIKILGDTPDLSRAHGDRVDECIQWLSQNAPNAAFIIVDDLDLVGMNRKMQPSHFVRTDDECGLTPELVEQAVIKLEMQAAPLPSPLPTSRKWPPCKSNARSRRESLPRVVRSILSCSVIGAHSLGPGSPAAWAIWRYVPSGTSRC